LSAYFDFFLGLSSFAYGPRFEPSTSRIQDQSLTAEPARPVTLVDQPQQGKTGQTSDVLTPDTADRKPEQLIVINDTHPHACLSGVVCPLCADLTPPQTNRTSLNCLCRFNPKSFPRLRVNCHISDSCSFLCGLVVRVPGHRSRDPGSITGAKRSSEK
jgi:hypothetical protein